jgi:superfamily II DNA or RNA helicase
MACGTGKTLVALWVAEKVAQASSLQSASITRTNPQAAMPASRILVLVPSLALLRQTLHEWARETSWQSFAHLCVCSDPTVTRPGSDELLVRPTDLDFPVTTDSTQVRAFLAAAFDGVKLVFSTYQSAHVVAAGMKKSDAFDLAIFDEAHKTAGREGVHFGFALSDTHLAIKKRLFLTATPRHYDVRRRDKEGDARLVYSMDVPEVYGPVAHKLTFAEAARRGIICDYKVIISVVTSEMVNDHLLRHGEVMVKGDAVKARHVANQLALQAAVEKHGVGKIFTFHRSVASAAAFTGEGSEGIGNHLSGFDAFHVNGSMPTSQRENIMTEFRAAPRAVISNAKCLTEGVDVPAVDMVAFLTPKRSRVDIVQATGRAMRKAPGKTIGYVLVPLFVEQAKGETIEEALARTEFDEIWNVLQAMQEQDDILAEIIREMREERGRSKGFDDTLFREKAEVLGPQISLEALRNSISTACLEALGDNWDERFGQLKAFQERFGHCNVPARWPENPKLSQWVVSQRSKGDALSGGKRQRLNDLGFIWEVYDSRWEEMLETLIAYKAKQGDCKVPPNWADNPILARWVRKQRGRRAELSKERVQRLDQIGFVWELLDNQWEEMFAALVAYKQRHGDCNVPARWPENLILSQWVITQRSNRDKLEAAKRAQLDEVGFTWQVRDSQWQEIFNGLVAFKKAHGHCKVPQKWRENPRLASWVSGQRTNRDKLSGDKRSLLDALGFVWDAVGDPWQEMFNALLAYKERFGHTKVPRSWGESQKLANWVVIQRRDKDKLSDAKRMRLEEIGFAWSGLEDTWNKMFAALVSYKKTHGHTNVPARSTEYRELSQWVITQRHRPERLTGDRRQSLEKIAFVWDVFAAQWEEMFAALVNYKAEHGHCRVPRHWIENSRLAQWVTTQRTKRNKLSEDRIRRLDELGFQWSIRGV